MTPLVYRSAGELARMIREREISSRELTETYIERIEKHDRDVNAVVVRDFDRARAAATRADERLAAGEAPGALHGVPMTIKEAYDIEGLPTTWGVPAFRDNIASSDAHAVSKLVGAGALFLGKTNVPLNLADFQSYNEIYGTTGNPWDLERTPGGSSGGSAAALAAGLTALECGSDIGGSIRNPAHYCGVYGHKPTWGIFPPQGHALPGQVASPDIAVCGPMARSAEDLALVMEIAAGPEPLDRRGWRLTLPEPVRSSLSDFKVALWPSDALAPVAREIADRVVSVGETLAKLGATVTDSARPDFDLKRAHAIYLNLLNSVMGASVPRSVYERAEAEARQLDPDDFSERAVLARALVLSHRDWLVNDNQRTRLRQAWRAFFDEWDILICPQTATAAFPHDHSPIPGRTLQVDGEMQPYFQQLFWAGVVTAPYLPSTVFPTGPSPSGLPIGLQAVGAEYDDRITIDFTRLLAREIGGFQSPPGY